MRQVRPALACHAPRANSCQRRPPQSAACALQRRCGRHVAQGASYPASHASRAQRGTCRTTSLRWCHGRSTGCATAAVQHATPQHNRKTARKGEFSSA
jgi:hypothetical protein